MSILFIMGVGALIAAPCEAVADHRNCRKVKPYRKPDDRNRHKKSPSTFHSNGL